MSIQSIREDLSRFQHFPGGVLINQRNASVYHIARRMFSKLDKENLLPCSVEECIESTFLEGWFVRSFYYGAIANLVHIKALDLNGEQLSKGQSYALFQQDCERYFDYLEKSKQATEKQTATFREGKEKALKELVPAFFHNQLVGYSDFSGVVVSDRNYKKRVVPGKECLVELGKRHYYWQSDISGKKECLSAVFFSVGIVEQVNEKTVTVRFGDNTHEVEKYRISKIKS